MCWQDFDTGFMDGLADEIILESEGAHRLKLTKDDIEELAAAVVPAAHLVGLGCSGCSYDKDSKKT